MVVTEEVVRMDLYPVFADARTDIVDAGATVLREPDDDISWWILADPEGNEFCAFPPGTGD